MTEFFWTLLPFLVPLVALSVYSVGLIVHKAHALRSAPVLASDAFQSLLDDVEAGRRVSLAETHPLAVLLAHADEGASRLQARAQGLLQDLEDKLSHFPALANISTLTGLFGTVCGMIGAFLALRSGGGADPSALAGGLGTALIATAVGLVTAIPSLGAHALFSRRVSGLAQQMEALLATLLGRAQGG